MSNVSPNPDEINAMREAAPSGPIMILSLVKFRAEGGQEAYTRYKKVAEELINALGLKGEALYAGMGGRDFAAGEEWDEIILARYQSFEAFASLITHTRYINEAIPLRDAALEKAVLMMTRPMNLQ